MLLVIAEHDNKTLNAATLNTVAAASQLGDDIHVLVAGEGVAEVAKQAAAAAGVAKVLVADGPALAKGLAVNIATLGLAIAEDYSQILCPAPAAGRNTAPRVAAQIDVAQVSDILSVESADTFTHPISAGNAIASVESSDPVKVITVRTTAFDAVASEGGDAAIENIEDRKKHTSELQSRGHLVCRLLL